MYSNDNVKKELSQSIERLKQILPTVKNFSGEEELTVLQCALHAYYETMKNMLLIDFDCIKKATERLNWLENYEIKNGNLNKFKFEVNDLKFTFEIDHSGKFFISIYKEGEGLSLSFFKSEDFRQLLCAYLISKASEECRQIIYQQKKKKILDSEYMKTFLIESKTTIPTNEAPVNLPQTPLDFKKKLNLIGK